MSRILKFIPRGSEQIPAMLSSTPDEGILNAEAIRWLGADTFGEFHGFDRGILNTPERAIELGRQIADEIRRRLKDNDPS